MKPLGEFAYEVRDRHGAESDDELPVYGVDRTVGLTPDTRYSAKKKNKYKVIKPGMFAYNPMRLNIGSIGYCSREHSRGLVSPDYVVFALDHEKVDHQFFSYLIKSDYWRNWTEAAGVGSVRVRIYFRELANLELPLPPLPEQRAIAHILGTLDDKIELNRRMNATLEAMARALFQSWFVDFDPVRAKAAGKTPAGMDRPIADLFPSHFEDSELGEIPKGWEVKPASEVLDINPVRRLKAGTVAPYVDMKNMPTAGHAIDHVTEREAGSGSKFLNGDTLLARITPCLENGKTAFVDCLTDDDTVAWGSTEYIVLRPKLPLPLEYAYYLARSNNFRGHAIRSMTGTSGRQRVPTTCFEHFQLAVPPAQIVRVFGETVRVLMDRIRSNVTESRTLAALRDTSLPELLSGRVAPRRSECVCGEHIMSVADMFSEFVSNLAITNGEVISLRYGELTAALNKKFRDTESKTANTLQVGSFGRNTGINGISDLDMLYIMPKGKWDDYKDGRQLKLLQDTKDAILARYPNTDVKVDRVVVTVTYNDFHVEVQPVFEQDDQSYKYPDTKGDGAWKLTKPRDEMEEMSSADTKKNANLKRLCKMVRAWRNKHGQQMGGLLIDTLAYNFLSSTDYFDDKSYLYYDFLSRDFFKYIADEPDQTEYAAPGSRQRVRVKKKFQRKAKKAYQLCVEAIAAQGQKNVNDKWRKVFGRPFPTAKVVATDATLATSASSWRNTEEFIEDSYPVDIQYSLTMDCKVEQAGFRPAFLREMLSKRFPLLVGNSLEFWIKEITVPKPFLIMWKVLNRGETARRKDCIRGQIVPDGGNMRKIETTNFDGDHVVDCYAIKDGVVVAKDRIHVPIQG